MNTLGEIWNQKIHSARDELRDEVKPIDDFEEAVVAALGEDLPG